LVGKTGNGVVKTRTTGNRCLRFNTATTRVNGWDKTVACGIDVAAIERLGISHYNAQQHAYNRQADVGKSLTNHEIKF
jgi:hypothetical protein